MNRLTSFGLRTCNTDRCAYRYACARKSTTLYGKRTERCTAQHVYHAHRGHQTTSKLVRQAYDEYVKRLRPIMTLDTQWHKTDEDLEAAVRKDTGVVVSGYHRTFRCAPGTWWSRASYAYTPTPLLNIFQVYTTGVCYACRNNVMKIIPW